MVSSPAYSPCEPAFGCNDTPANPVMTDRGIRKYLAQSRAPQTRMHHYFFLYQYCMRSCPYCAAKLGTDERRNHAIYFANWYD